MISKLFCNYWLSKPKVYIVMMCFMCVVIKLYARQKTCQEVVNFSFKVGYILINLEVSKNVQYQLLHQIILLTFLPCLNN